MRDFAHAVERRRPTAWAKAHVGPLRIIPLGATRLCPPYEPRRLVDHPALSYKAAGAQTAPRKKHGEETGESAEHQDGRRK